MKGRNGTKGQCETKKVVLVQCFVLFVKGATQAVDVLRIVSQRREPRWGRCSKGVEYGIRKVFGHMVEAGPCQWCREREDHFYHWDHKRQWRQLQRQVSLHACVRVCVHEHTPVLTCECVCISVCVCTCECLRLCVCTCVSLCVYMCELVCVHACMCWGVVCGKWRTYTQSSLFLWWSWKWSKISSRSEVLLLGTEYKLLFYFILIALLWNYCLWCIKPNRKTYTLYLCLLLKQIPASKVYRTTYLNCGRHVSFAFVSLGLNHKVTLSMFRRPALVSIWTLQRSLFPLTLSLEDSGVEICGEHLDMEPEMTDEVAMRMSPFGGSQALKTASFIWALWYWADGFGGAAVALIQFCETGNLVYQGDRKGGSGCGLSWKGLLMSCYPNGLLWPHFGW